MATESHDIVVQATDLLGQDVELVIANNDLGFYERRATIVGVVERDVPHLVVENYRIGDLLDSFVVDRTIVSVSEIIEIRA